MKSSLIPYEPLGPPESQMTPRQVRSVSWPLVPIRYNPGITVTGPVQELLSPEPQIERTYTSYACPPMSCITAFSSYTVMPVEQVSGLPPCCTATIYHSVASPISSHSKAMLSGSVLLVLTKSKGRGQLGMGSRVKSSV